MCQNVLNFTGMQEKELKTFRNRINLMCEKKKKYFVECYLKFLQSKLFENGI